MAPPGPLFTSTGQLTEKTVHPPIRGHFPSKYRDKKKAQKMGQRDPGRESGERAANTTAIESHAWNFIILRRRGKPPHQTLSFLAYVPLGSDSQPIEGSVVVLPRAVIGKVVRDAGSAITFINTRLGIGMYQPLLIDKEKGEAGSETIYLAKGFSGHAGAVRQSRSMTFTID